MLSRKTARYCIKWLHHKLTASDAENDVHVFIGRSSRPLYAIARHMIGHRNDLYKLSANRVLLVDYGRQLGAMDDEKPNRLTPTHLTKQLHELLQSRGAFEGNRVHFYDTFSESGNTKKQYSAAARLSGKESEFHTLLENVPETDDKKVDEIVILLSESSQNITKSLPMKNTKKGLFPTYHHTQIALSSRTISARLKKAWNEFEKNLPPKKAL